MTFDRAASIIADARRLVVLTGAGVSTESGVPDFRGTSGIWEKFDPGEFVYDRFLRDPRGPTTAVGGRDRVAITAPDAVRFWELRARLMEALDLASVKPNAAHEAIARASRSPRFLGHVTQNIDGLFQAAGHREENLVEMHGSARKVRCIDCARFFPYERISLAKLPPSCPECGGVVKPGTILFGELLHEPDLRRAEDWFARADVVLVVGSSLVVHPVAGLPAVALARGARLVIVNRDTTPYDDEADAVVRASAGEAVPAILQSLVSGV